MENNHITYYDLAVLMEQGDLNIRKVAVNTRYMTAGEYFGMLTELIVNEPRFLEDMHRMISRDSDRNTFKSLSGMITMLTNLGYEKHTTDFDGLLDAYDRGHSRQTSTYARQIMDDFEGLCTRIKHAMVTQAPGDSTPDPKNIYLRDWINRPVEEISIRKPLVLAIDDSPIILMSVSSLLSGNYKVYTLAKPAMLDKVLSQIKPDLFLLDYNMPELNGFELVPIIRGFEGHKDTPIIFLTSSGTVDYLSSAVMLGACDFIVKPVQPVILREKIAKHIQRKVS